MKLKSNFLKWKQKQSDQENFSYLFLKELNEREIYLLQRAQQDTYPEEFNKLFHNKDIERDIDVNIYQFLVGLFSLL